MTKVIMQGKLGKYEVDVEVPEGIALEQTFLIKDIFGDLIKYRYHGTTSAGHLISLVPKEPI